MLIESFSIFICAFRFGHVRKIFKDNDSQIPFSIKIFRQIFNSDKLASNNNRKFEGTT
jgi:hypothetical protein